MHNKIAYSNVDLFARGRCFTRYAGSNASESTHFTRFLQTRVYSDLSRPAGFPTTTATSWRENAGGGGVRANNKLLLTLKLVE